MKRYYCYAGVNICIEGKDEWMYEDDRMLSSFRVDNAIDTDNFYFKVVDDLKEAEGTLIAHDGGFLEYENGEKRIKYIGSVNHSYENAYMRISNAGKNHYVSIKKSSLKDKIPTHVIYSAIESERLLMNNNAIIMHASYIEYNGKAILFTAPSGTGKSTQAELWKNLRGANILNGDRVAVRNVDGTLYACGVPFAGSSNICVNKTLPLCAIVTLSQAPVTTIEKVDGFPAFLSLYEGSGILTWDKKHVEFVCDFLQNLISCIPVYKLACTPDESAVIALEKMIRE